MLVPFHEPVSTGASAVAAAETAIAANEDGVGSKPSREHSAGGQAAVAVLLALAAVVAAIVGTRASLLAGQASGQWQGSLRTEIKRTAIGVHNVAYMYDYELTLAVRCLQADMYQQALETAAETATGAEQQALRAEAAVQAEVATQLKQVSELASSEKYQLPGGGFDLGLRLADNRNEYPEFVALDPTSLREEGDKLSGKAELMTLALIPASLAALLAVLAQPFRRGRRWLLAAGAVALVAAVAVGLGVEFLA
jgi:hypothetical protein